MVGTVRQRTLRLVLLSQLGVLLFVLKIAMAGLPNIEPVSLLVMVYTVTLGRWALVPIYLYVALEYIVWGLNLWSICYLYIWLFLWILSWLLRKMDSALGWAVLSGAFGMCFGFLCALVYIPVDGWAFAFSWWISGIPFDALHCAGNFFMALVLFSPLKKWMGKALQKIGGFSPPKL